MAKDIKFKSKARKELFKGIKKLNKSVSVTLGPQGRNVLIDAYFGNPRFTKDGVTVAKQVELPDRLQNMGASLIKVAASKTNDKAGDGTTTSTLLTYTMVKEGLKHITAGANPMDLKNGIQKTGELIVDSLKERAIPIKNTKKDLSQIAYISANNDSSIGDMIGEAYEKVGKEGVISIEDSRTNATYVDMVEGLQFDRGYISPYFSTNKKEECILKEVKVLLYNGKISHIKTLLPVLELTAGKGLALLIIADEVEGEALESLIMNKMEAGVKVCCVKSPGFGERRLEYLEDIASVTGGKLISQKKGTSLITLAKKDGESSDIWESRVNSYLGDCQSITVTFDSTVIVGGHGTKEMIEFRKEEIKNRLLDPENDYEKEQLEERLAKIQGGIGVIYVGGATEEEVKEKRDRIEDARKATKAALEEGIINGGGIELLSIAHNIEFINKISKDKFKTEDEHLGAQIVLKAMEAPFKQIIKNAGLNPDVIFNNIKVTPGGFKGFDSKSGEYVDNMVKAGIIDPVKVTRIALENACSIAGLILTTEAVLINRKEDEDRTKGLPTF